MQKLGWCRVVVLAVGCASARGQGPLILAPSDAVQGAPFTVTVETHWERARDLGAKHGTQRILRDSAGRVRIETAVIDGVVKPETVGIYDVVAGKHMRLNLEAKTAEVGPMHVGQTYVVNVAVATSLAPTTAGEGQTLLGTQEIAGQEAWGQRTVRETTRNDGSPVTQDREVWLSTHYRIPLMQVTRRDQNTMTQRVVSFTAGEPDAGLFKIPEGFTVTDILPPPEPAPGTVRVGGSVLAPQVVKQPEAEYSDEARRKKISGNVLVYLVVDEDGLPQHVKVIRGLGAGLDEKAVEAVQHYRFKPATRDGVPVKVEVNVEVNFQIFGK